MTLLIISGAGLLALATISIVIKPDQSMIIFNVFLPVASSWVGTVIAFYFGRENFESANKQVRELISKFSPEEREQTQIVQIMRSAAEVVKFKIAAGQSAKTVKVADVKALYQGDISRMPIVDQDDVPLFMLHSSSLDRFLVNGGQLTDSFDKLLTDEKARGFEFGPGRGFVLVSKTSTIAAAKKAMEDAKNCQDIFVTETGAAKEPLLGWVANTRLSKFLQR